MSSSKIELIKSNLDQYPEYQEKLFIRGYMITDAELSKLDRFPFYNNWRDYRLGEFNIRIHNKQHFFYKKNDDVSVFIIGNCVDPYDMEYDGSVIVDELFESLLVGKARFLEKVNQLTGSFVIGIVKGKTISFLRDPTGMLYATYGIVREHFYISSHAQLLDDLLDLEKDDYIRRLERYRFFHVYGIVFPGDITQFSQLKRALQNHITAYDGSSVSVERFFPTTSLEKVKTEEEYNELLEDIVGVLHKTLVLCTKKWADKKVAISLTGGLDSKLTFACANGLYDKIGTYSYVSMLGDKIDADAASIIAKEVDATHTVYNISENDEDFENIEIDRLIIEHNKGDYHCHPNDVRKRRYFSDGRQFDIEIKSWASEVARPMYNSKLGIKKFPRLDSNRMTSMYKIFTTQRRLANDTSRIFGDFIKKSKFDSLLPYGYDEPSMFYWEFRASSWAGMVITSEQYYSNEIFVPINNRILLNSLLRTPYAKKLTDEHYHDLVKKINPKVEELGIVIKDWNLTTFRKYIENFHFRLNSMLTKKY